MIAALEHILQTYGIDICASEWGKSLGDGLYEFRVRKSLRTILTAAGISSETPGNDRKVLIRVFCTFHGEEIVLLYHGYNKKIDPSPKRQQREIKKARKLHDQWRRRHKR